MKKQDKTNVMRILDQRKVQYESHYYTETDAVSGMDVATVMGRIRIRCLKYWSQ